MVGVPGKYKGCETCRLRRVKCDNLRPYCKKCHDTGRECLGYERKPVFIIGTPEDGGRCSSHPPRIIKARKASNSSSGGAGASRSRSRSDGTASPAVAAAVSPSPLSVASASSPALFAETSQQPHQDLLHHHHYQQPLPPGPFSPSAFSPPQSDPGTVDPFFSYETPYHGFTAAPDPGPVAPFLPIETGQQQETLNLVPVLPLQPAWDNAMVLAAANNEGGGGGNNDLCAMQFAALVTHLPALVRQHDDSSGPQASAFVLESFPAYVPAAVPPPDLCLAAQCLVHLTDGAGDVPHEGMCLFLYEVSEEVDEAGRSDTKRGTADQHASVAANPAPWDDGSSSGDNNGLCQAGPGQYTAFPAHHFFTRVYRPTAIWAALLNRQPTFLADPAWTTVPWEAHPKTWLDQLLDLLVLVPPLLARADEVLLLLGGGPGQDNDNDNAAAVATGHRLAQDLLGHCRYVEQTLAQWYARMQAETGLLAGVDDDDDDNDNDNNNGKDDGDAGAEADADADADGDNKSLNGSLRGSRTSSTASRGSGGAGTVPASFFDANRGQHDRSGTATRPSTTTTTTTTTAAMDAATALVFVFYWAALVLLWPTMARLQGASPGSFAAAASVGSPAGSPAPYGPRAVRRAAARVCRGLDAALAATAQPDLLTAPLHAVETFYRVRQQAAVAAGDGNEDGDGDGDGYGTRGVLWCEGFRARLVARGQYMADMVQTRRWVDAAQF